MSQDLIFTSYIASTTTTTRDTEIFKEENPFEYTNRIAVKYIWPTVPIGFLILGTLANILSIVVFTRKEMRKFSSFCYFAFLNAINLAALYITLIRVIMNYNFSIDIRTLNMFTCKMHVFLTYFLGHLSSLLLCMISIDRVISVMFLHKAKSLCTPRVAFNVTVVLVIFNFFLSSHFLIFESGHYIMPNATELSNNLTNHGLIKQYIKCDAKENTNYFRLLQDVWKIVDMSVYAFIPFIIMLASSIIIIVRVAQQSKKFSKKPTLAKQQSLVTQTVLEGKNEILTKNSSIESSSKHSLVTNTMKNANEAKFSTRTRNLAMMLIPVNILFLMFMAPVVITMYIHEKLANDELTLAIVEHLSYCNFTFNFFIYFVTSSKFREEFFKFLNEMYFKLKIKSNADVLNNHNTNAYLSVKHTKVNNTEYIALVGNGKAKSNHRVNEKTQVK